LVGYSVLPEGVECHGAPCRWVEVGHPTVRARLWGISGVGGVQAGGSSWNTGAERIKGDTVNAVIDGELCCGTSSALRTRNCCEQEW
jgi:hypothetical protein